MTPTGITPDQTPPTALRDYALIADGERGALIGPRGEIAWMCAPRWHDDALFSSLVGGPGSYRVAPSGQFVWGGFYEDGTLIWNSRWVTRDGIVESREALAFPGDPGRCVLLRRLRAREGDVRVHVFLQAAPGFGREPVRDLGRDESGAWNARCGSLLLRWTGGGAARVTGTASAPELSFELTLAEGRTHDLVLELGGSLGPPVDPDEAWRATREAWRREVPALHGTIAPLDARQSYAVLRGLTAGTGGMVAAATTSLPERAEQGRNYDYRYVWIRDLCYTGEAVAAAGRRELLGSSVGFVTARLLEDGPRLAPAYTADGSPVPDQRRLDLPGYPGGYDLVGNHVNDQFQLDTFGEALLLFAAAARHEPLPPDARKAALLAQEAIARRWHEPDAGIWELDNRIWTHSRLTCVAGLRALARVPGWPDPDTARRLADEILAHTAKQCTHPSGRWQRAADDPAVDAALLLPMVRGAQPPDDPCSVATIDAIRRELSQDHYLYRFRQDQGPLEDAEGAFVLCGFVMALTQHRRGLELDALRWFERNRAACGATGLFAEEYDVRQRQLRGNLPQAFVHALLLESAVRLAEPPRRAADPDPL